MSFISTIMRNTCDKHFFSITSCFYRTSIFYKTSNRWDSLYAPYGGSFITPIFKREFTSSSSWEKKQCYCFFCILFILVCKFLLTKWWQSYNYDINIAESNIRIISCNFYFTLKKDFIVLVYYFQIILEKIVFFRKDNYRVS